MKKEYFLFLFLQKQKNFIMICHEKGTILKQMFLLNHKKKKRQIFLLTLFSLNRSLKNIKIHLFIAFFPDLFKKKEKKEKEIFPLRDEFTLCS